MVHYTIIPSEELFLGDEEPPALIAAAVSGVPVLVAPLGDGLARIERLLSTDPNHFLDPRFQPGTLVSLTR